MSQNTQAKHTNRNWTSGSVRVLQLGCRSQTSGVNNVGATSDSPPPPLMTHPSRGEGKGNDDADKSVESGPLFYGEEDKDTDMEEAEMEGGRKDDEIQ
eukprot:6990012-Ditylum_brightwellii.AAC.1